MRNLPVYADSLIADLDYPLAWGHSDIRDFGEWKQTARQKVFDCMLMPPPPPVKGYEARVLFEEQRNGYKARKIEIRLSRYYAVTAYVLIPDGKGLSLPSTCSMTTVAISLSARRSASVRWLAKTQR